MQNRIALIVEGGMWRLGGLARIGTVDKSAFVNLDERFFVFLFL